MKKLLFAAALMLASSAYAQSPDYMEMADGESSFYAGFGYNAFEVGSLTAMVPDFDLDGFELTLGYQFTDIVSGEFQHARLNSSYRDDVDILKLGILFHVLNDKFRPFARFGYVGARYKEGSGHGSRLLGNEPYFLGGVGIDFDLPSNIILRAEYQRIGYELGVGGFNLAAMYRF